MHFCLTESFLFSQLRLRRWARWHIALDFLSELGQWLIAATDDVLKTSFLIQRLSVAIRCYNFVIVCESFGVLLLNQTCGHSSYLFLIFVLVLPFFTPWGKNNNSHNNNDNTYVG